MLRDRNTIRMVAEHWGCCTETVRRRIKDGVLPCLRISGLVRITREQVEACEAACTSSGNTPTASVTPSLATGSKSAFQRGREIAGKLKRSSLNSSSPQPNGTATQ
jgi:hypothetical protein